MPCSNSWGVDDLPGSPVAPLVCRVALRLPGLQDPLTGSHPVGPCKRSAAGQDIRHGILDFAGWRLHLTRPTAPNHRWRWGR
ncbi:hypothetical protein SB30_280128 [Klebsiella quasipneumoniae subsp. similipneumoniae]|nr:hypothetical protein SB30_280128 [Klebsiella quasipneumoniae subsp. similipneumoniae]